MIWAIGDIAENDFAYWYRCYSSVIWLFVCDVRAFCSNGWRYRRDSLAYNSSMSHPDRVKFGLRRSTPSSSNFAPKVTHTHSTTNCWIVNKEVVPLHTVKEKFQSDIARVPPDPRFSLSVLLIFGMVCHLTILIFHPYPGSGVALTLLIFLTILSLCDCRYYFGF